jgi:hypothetical protein
MRKIAIFLPLTLLLGMSSFAQTSFELVPSIGYTFANQTNFYSTYGKIGEGMSYGGSMNFNFTRNVGIEVLYSHQNTTSSLYNYGDPVKVTGQNLAFDYIMMGPVSSFTIPNSTVRPFIGVLFGAAILTPDAGTGDMQQTKFAMGGQFGFNCYLSPHLAIQIKGQVLSPVDQAGAGFFFSNYGVGTTVSGYSNVYQLSLGGGLIFGLGKVLEPQQSGPHYSKPHYRYYNY